MQGRPHDRLLVRDLAIDPVHPETVYAATDHDGVDGRLAESRDHGGSWHPIGPDGLRILTLAFDPRDPARLLAGTERGVYLSRDGGAHLRPLASGFVAPVGELRIDPRSSSVLYAAVAPADSLYAATYGQGVLAATFGRP